MHGYKNIESANPLFSGIIMSSPYFHVSGIRVKVVTQQVSGEDIHNIRGTLPCPVRRKLATLISCFKRKE